MAIPNLFSITAKKQLQLIALPMRRNQWLVLLLLPTFRVLRNPSREFWIAPTLKLLKNLFKLWGTFLPNLWILSRKNKLTNAIYSILCNGCDNQYINGPNLSLVHIWKSIKRHSSFAKKKIQLYWSTHAEPTIQLGGISLKLSPLISITTSTFVWKPGISTQPTLLWIAMMAAYFLTCIYTLSEKKAAN